MVDLPDWVKKYKTKGVEIHVSGKPKFRNNFKITNTISDISNINKHYFLNIFP